MLCQIGCTRTQTLDAAHSSAKRCNLQGVGDKYNGQVGDDVATIVQFMWQHDTCAIAKFINECKCTWAPENDV